MNTRCLLNTAANTIVLFGLLAFMTSRAHAGSSETTVTVCNQGRIDVNVVIGTQAPLPLFVRNLDVAAWTSIKPGSCRQVYHGVGDYDTGEGIMSSYLGFGFYNSRNQLIAGHAGRLPDLGFFKYGTLILTAANDRFCVRDTSSTYTIREHAVLDCATFRSSANDPGGYTSFPTVLKILPRPWGCDESTNVCSFGDFYLNVTATADSPEIQITGRIGKDEQPEQSAGPGLGSQILQQLEKAAAERNSGPLQEQPDTAAQARADAIRGSNICVPDDLIAEWNNPPAGGKMEVFQQQLKASLRERATLQDYDQTKWFMVDSNRYRSWDLRRPFQTFVTATDGGSCSIGHREYLSLTPSTAAAPDASEEARQRRVQKAIDCRHRAVNDYPQGGAARTQEYASCLQAK